MRESPNFLSFKGVADLFEQYRDVFLIREDFRGARDFPNFQGQSPLSIWGVAAHCRENNKLWAFAFLIKPILNVSIEWEMEGLFRDNGQKVFY